MTPASNQYVDDLILRLVTMQWQKVAMIVAKTLRECEDRGVEVTEDTIASRIQALFKQGRLEAQGDLSKWRHSEVRLATESS